MSEKESFQKYRHRLWSEAVEGDEEVGRLVKASPYGHSSLFEEHPRYSSFVFKDFERELESGYSGEDEVIDRYIRRLQQRGYKVPEARKKLEEKLHRIKFGGKDRW